jgi:hypothetical protein
MSTIKSSAENLTLNADGANNDIKFQSNGSEVASIDQAGTITATTFTGAGSTPSITDNGNANAMTIDSAENVGFGSAPTSFYSGYTGVQVGGNGTFYGQTAAGADKNLWLSQNARAGTDGSEKAISTGTSSQIMMSSGNVTLKTGASASADANVTWTTGFEVLADGKARAKNGLLFGTDTAAANALDDYEEGTWSPDLIGHTGSAGSHAHNLVGQYIKIGGLVWVRAYGYLTNKGSYSGNARLNGFPFAPDYATAGTLAMFPSTEVDANMRTISVTGSTTKADFMKGSRLDIAVPWSEIVTSYYLSVSVVYAHT